LDAQAEQFDLKKKIAELEQELGRFRLWETERARYALIELSPGVFVRSVKDDARGNEPQHWLCCNCFDEGKKSILQFAYGAGERKGYTCHRCNSTIITRQHSPSGPAGSTARGPGSWMTS
jgi:hypothetical protein